MLCVSSIKSSQIDLPFLKNDFILFEIYTKAAIKIDLILMTTITNLYVFCSIHEI